MRSGTASAGWLSETRSPSTAVGLWAVLRVRKRRRELLHPGGSVGNPPSGRRRSGGALAEYLIVDDVRPIAAWRLGPVATVSLTDAGLTPYHAIAGSLGALPAGSAPW